MNDNDRNDLSDQENRAQESYKKLLEMAYSAMTSGDRMMAAHLFLASFEALRRCEENDANATEALICLRRVWDLACEMNERAIAEYAFEQLDPYISTEEANEYAGKLQQLAFEKLAEYGLSPEEVEEMEEMLGADDFADAIPISITLPSPAGPSVSRESFDKEREEAKRAAASSAETAAKSSEVVEESIRQAKEQFARAFPPPPQQDKLMTGNVRYSSLAGFDHAIEAMKAFGIGVGNNREYAELVEMLNRRHGLTGMPAADSIVFSSPAREDANYFMASTIAELDVPAVRMRMEEGPQGVPLLCVMTQADKQPRMNASHTVISGPAALVLEDLDLWSPPNADPQPEEVGGAILASVASRGARDAINLIRSSVENPDVYVFASSSTDGMIDPFFLDLLEPMSFLNIDYPDDLERHAVWLQIARDHPSLRSIDMGEVIYYSRRLPRYDMFMAAREAIDDAYRRSLMLHKYVPVTPTMLFERFAAYQPLDSGEYREIEDVVVSEFKQGLDDLDGLYNDGGM